MTARVFDLDARPLWQRTAKLDAHANACQEIFAVPGLTNLAPFVFVQLQLKDAAGRPVSDNFYWLRGQGATDYKALQKLPLVKLDATLRVENAGEEKLVRVKVTNPTDHIAFFIQLALTKGAGGEEILPVIWSDNYFSLVPGETRELTARLAKRDLAGQPPTLEVGGWNIATGYGCVALSPAKPTVKSGETCTLTARITDTFLDGSRVQLLVDGKPADTQWAWARSGKSDEITFTLKLSQPGKHRLSVANRTAELVVE